MYHCEAPFFKKDGGPEEWKKGMVLCCEQKKKNEGETFPLYSTQSTDKVVLSKERIFKSR